MCPIDVSGPEAGARILPVAALRRGFTASQYTGGLNPLQCPNPGRQASMDVDNWRLIAYLNGLTLRGNCLSKRRFRHLCASTVAHQPEDTRWS